MCTGGDAAGQCAAADAAGNGSALAAAATRAPVPGRADSPWQCQNRRFDVWDARISTLGAGRALCIQHCGYTGIILKACLPNTWPSYGHVGHGTRIVASCWHSASVLRWSVKSQAAAWTPAKVACLCSLNTRSPLRPLVLKSPFPLPSRCPGLLLRVWACFLSYQYRLWMNDPFRWIALAHNGECTTGQPAGGRGRAAVRQRDGGPGAAAAGGRRRPRCRRR